MPLFYWELMQMRGNSYIMILFLVAKITRRLLLKYMTLELLQKSKMYSLERCS